MGKKKITSEIFFLFLITLSLLSLIKTQSSLESGEGSGEGEADRENKVHFISVDSFQQIKGNTTFTYFLYGKIYGGNFTETRFKGKIFLTNSKKKQLLRLRYLDDVSYNVDCKQDETTFTEDLAKKFAIYNCTTTSLVKEDLKENKVTQSFEVSNIQWKDRGETILTSYEKGLASDDISDNIESYWKVFLNSKASDIAIFSVENYNCKVNRKIRTDFYGKQPSKLNQNFFVVSSSIKIDEERKFNCTVYNKGNSLNSTCISNSDEPDMDMILHFGTPYVSNPNQVGVYFSLDDQNLQCKAEEINNIYKKSSSSGLSTGAVIIIIIVAVVVIAAIVVIIMIVKRRKERLEQEREAGPDSTNKFDSDMKY